LIEENIVEAETLHATPAMELLGTPFAKKEEKLKEVA